MGLNLPGRQFWGGLLARLPISTMSLEPWLEREESPHGRKRELTVGVRVSTTLSRLREWYYVRKFNKVLEEAKARLKKIQDEAANSK